VNRDLEDAFRNSDTRLARTHLHMEQVSIYFRSAVVSEDRLKISPSGAGPRIKDIGNLRQLTQTFRAILMMAIG
jgi:hypothetical protein